MYSLLLGQQAEHPLRPLLAPRVNYVRLAFPAGTTTQAKLIWFEQLSNDFSKTLLDLVQPRVTSPISICHVNKKISLNWLKVRLVI